MEANQPEMNVNLKFKQWDVEPDKNLNKISASKFKFNHVQNLIHFLIKESSSWKITSFSKLLDV